MTLYADIDLSQHWFRQWLGAWRHQAIAWTNVVWSSVMSGDIAGNAFDSYPWYDFENYYFKVITASLRGQWVKAKWIYIIDSSCIWDV